MLRQIIGIPEGVYYRGRFRATTAWSKVSRREGEDSPAIVNEERFHGIDDPERMPRERAISAKTEMTALQMGSVGL